MIHRQKNFLKEKIEEFFLEGNRFFNHEGYTLASEMESFIPVASIIPRVLF
jgi:hypothetical protein